MSRQTVSLCTCDRCGLELRAVDHVPTGWGSIIATVYGAGYGEQSASGEVVYCAECVIETTAADVIDDLHRQASGGQPVRPER